MNALSPHLTCPECRLSMRELERFDVEIDSCTNCSGIWFDAAEMVAYTKGRSDRAQESKVPDQPFTPDTAAPKQHCPRCRSLSLLPGVSGDYTMSFCTHCKGVYLPLLTHRQLFSASTREPPKPEIEFHDYGSRVYSEPAMSATGNALGTLVREAFRNWL